MINKLTVDFSVNNPSPARALLRTGAAVKENENLMNSPKHQHRRQDHLHVQFECIIQVKWVARLPKHSGFCIQRECKRDSHTGNTSSIEEILPGQALGFYKTRKSSIKVCFLSTREMFFFDSLAFLKIEHVFMTCDLVLSV